MEPGRAIPSIRGRCDGTPGQVPAYVTLVPDTAEDCGLETLAEYKKHDPRLPTLLVAVAVGHRGRSFILSAQLPSCGDTGCCTSPQLRKEQQEVPAPRIKKMLVQARHSQVGRSSTAHQADISGPLSTKPRPRRNICFRCFGCFLSIIFAYSFASHHPYLSVVNLPVPEIIISDYSTHIHPNIQHSLFTWLLDAHLGSVVRTTLRQVTQVSFVYINHENIHLSATIHLPDFITICCFLALPAPFWR